MSDSFQGFRVPDQNYFKMPNEWMDIMGRITSLAELKVIMYVLRHTWGFSEYGLMKKITTDEFMHGRKQQDGTRMDAGTGMSHVSIIEGLRRAVENGFLIVRVEGEDKARMKKYFGLKMDTSPPDLRKESLLHQTPRTFTPDVKNNYDSYKKTLHRTEKDTIRKTKVGRLQNAHTLRDGFLDASFCDKGATRLMNILVKYESDLVQPPRRIRMTSLAKNFSSLLIDRQISKERIKRVVKWLEDHYGDEFTPKMHKVDDFCRNFKRYEDAMSRTRREDGQEPQASPRQLIIDEFRERLMSLQNDHGRNPFTSDVLQSEIDEITKQMGLPSGSISRVDL